MCSRTNWNDRWRGQKTRPSLFREPFRPGRWAAQRTERTKEFGIGLYFYGFFIQIDFFFTPNL